MTSSDPDLERKHHVHQVHPACRRLRRRLMRSAAGPGGRQSEDRLHQHPLGARRRARRSHPRRLQPGTRTYRRQGRRPAGRTADRGRHAKARRRAPARRAHAQARQGRRHDWHRVPEYSAGRPAAGIRGADLLHQHQHRPLGPGRREVQPVFLCRLVGQRQLFRSHRQERQRQGLQECLRDRAQLPGRRRCGEWLQALLQGGLRRRGLYQARPARLRGRAVAVARGQARRGVFLPARRHGRQLPQAVPAGGAEQGLPALRHRLVVRPGHAGRGGRRHAGRAQRRALEPRPRQRAEQALRRRLREEIRPPAQRIRLAGLRRGDADRRRGARREGPCRRQGRVRQGAAGG